MALVGHPVVEGVGPDGDTAKGSSDGGVVDKELVSHHLELLVSTDAEVGSANTNHGSISDVGKPLNDQPGTSHFSKPVIVRTFGPVLRVILVGDGEDSDLMTSAVKFLNSGVIGVLVGNVEGSLKAASVRIDPLSIEDLLKDPDVV